MMEQASREAMPNVPIIDSEWLSDYDDYYHQTTPSFELGRHKPAYVLPVLRVRYNDEKQTWLYFTPSLAQMVKFDKLDRANRWLYYGSARDGLARTVQSPAAVGRCDDRIVVRPCGDEYHNPVAGLPEAEAAHGWSLEMGICAEKGADFAEPGMGSIQQRSD